MVNQNGNELQNNGKRTEGQKGNNWGEEREEHDKGGKNTKIKEKEKLLTGIGRINKEKKYWLKKH